MRSFRDLRAWQRSIDLVEVIYGVSAQFPQDERFGLKTQIRSAAVSIPSNIAEGQGRATAGEWLQFLGHARGSLFELETQLVIAQRLNYLQKSSCDQVQIVAAGVASALTGLIKYVRSTKKRPE